MSSRKRGTRKRRAGRQNLGKLMRTLYNADPMRPWYRGRWSATGRPIVPGVRSKRGRR